jgi:hypothetical protein
MTVLTKAQRELMSEFYSYGFTKIVLDKSQRTEIWNCFEENREIPENYNLQKICPALLNEIIRAIDSESNIQSAVFSECSFAQTLANMFDLSIFTNHRNNPYYLQTEVVKLLQTYDMFPRYVYSNEDKSRLLIQAGGRNGVDSALISVSDYSVFTIEFKEAGAKSSEPDLPKYGEDGKLVITEQFKETYPQFVNMLNEHIGYDVFANMGRNESDFSTDSIKTAISNNYNAKKFADVICTEDTNGYLTMIPANQVDAWARLEGEIRTAGRNPYSVWTPDKLKVFIERLGGNIDNGIITITESQLTLSAPRGGTGVSRYKINNLFFVRSQNVDILGGVATFELRHVFQLNPTITAKMFFDNLDINNVHAYYKEQL